MIFSSEVCLTPYYSPSLVAINLIVQHIQDILNGGLTKRLNGCLNGHTTPRKRQPSESSSRPHWYALQGNQRRVAMDKGLEGGLCVYIYTDDLQTVFKRKKIKKCLLWLATVLLFCLLFFKWLLHLIVRGKLSLLKTVGQSYFACPINLHLHILSIWP